MKTLYFIFALVIFCSTSLSAHNPLDWRLNYSEYFTHINSVQILTDSVIVIAGGNEFNDKIRSIQSSYDGGQTWNIITGDFDSSWIKSLYFTNPSTGFAVGYEGAILSTSNGGQSWVIKSAPGTSSLRNFNSVFFINSQTGFIAGGNRSNDSIQTILKTIDGGNTWNISRDVPGYWLKAIHFIDQNNGFAVGEKGVALKTTNGGINWNQVTLPANVVSRNFNTVFFLNSNIGFLGGGNQSNDSIQTILKTTDGGNNWSIIRDNLSPWITSIHFPSQYPTTSTGFAVGDKGTVLITQDMGNSWNHVAIADTVNDTLGLRSVYFMNLDFGIASGAFGKTLVYRSSAPTTPIVQTGYATNIFSNEATLNGSVNTNGSNCLLSFEFWPANNPSMMITTTPDTISGSTSQPFSTDISGLTPNTLYYYQLTAKNISGIRKGKVKQFYAGSNPIPNWDFEWWEILTAFIPQTWTSTRGVSQTTSYDGSKAVALHGGRKFSAIVIGTIGDNLLDGAPFSARPDSMIGHFNYSTSLNDSALLVLFFKKNGTFNSQNIFHITGNSNGNYERLSFPITYSDSNTPDSVIIAILNTDPFFNTPDSSNYLAVDNISFSGTTMNIPNYDFEAWFTDSVERIISWYSGDDDDAIIFSSLVTKTTDSHHGNFAARFQNNPDNASGIATLSTSAYNSVVPAFPVPAKHLTLNGYLKYFPVNSDTLNIGVTMFYNGTYAGSGNISLDTLVPDYSPFFISLFYSDPNVIPDSATIIIFSGNGSAHGNSVLYIDELSFDGFYVSTENAIVNYRDDLSWEIFPNPAQDKITVNGFSKKAESVYFSVFDLNRKEIQTINKELPAGKFEFSIELKNLQSGSYMIILNGNEKKQFKKLIISR